MRRRGILAGVIAACAIVLAACAGMPTSGPVTVGLGSGDVDDDVDLSFLATGPQKGAGPEQIVQGFLAAGTSPQDNWAVAKEFLAPPLRETWNPNAGVTIDLLASREIAVTSDEAVSATVRPVADVDETGVYAEVDAGTVTLPFRLAQQADGEWRITEAEDGIVLDRDFFPQIYRSYSLMFFDPSWTFLVPDVRWFPARTNTASRIVTELIEGGPSPWLRGAVVSAFPEDISAPSSVTNDNGVAQVEVPVAALGLSRTQLDRMQAQLEESLATASFTGAVMTVGTVDIQASPAPTRSTRVEPRPAVLTKDGFGFLVGEELQPIAGISEGMRKLAPVGIELGPDRDVAAVRVESGAVVRLRSNQESTPVDERTGLIDPTVDADGFIWSVPAARPGALIAFAPDGTAHPVAGGWGDASRITSMELSRDGTRIVALVEVGGRHEAWVAGVQRDGDERIPVRLGEPLRLAVLPGTEEDVAWLDGETVGIVSSIDTDDIVYTQQVGGTRTSSNAPGDITTIVGGNQLTGARLAAADGTMYVRTGTRWQSSATGILILATQQGSPR